MKEDQLLTKFKEILINKNFCILEDLVLSPKNKSREMDFNIKNKLTDTWICLEAKVFNDTRSNSNMFLSLFGKIIKGRALSKTSNKLEGIDNFEYGFLFWQNNLEKIRTYFGIIEEKDWKTFCEDFDVKHIYICNDSDFVRYNAKEFIKEIQVNDIDKYLDDPSITEIDVENIEYNEQINSNL